MINCFLSYYYSDYIMSKLSVAICQSCLHCHFLTTTLLCSINYYLTYFTSYAFPNIVTAAAVIFEWIIIIIMMTMALMGFIQLALTE